MLLRFAGALAATPRCTAASIASTAPRSSAPCYWRSQHDTPCFKIMAIAGAGLGAVATRDIACGELIMAETPVMRTQAGQLSRWTAAQHQFDTLPLTEKRAVLRLSDSWRRAGKRKTLSGILRTNSIECSKYSDDGALCVCLSRFNHSCIPNCEQSWDSLAFKARIHACSPIPAGRELCLAYIDVRAPRTERSQLLWEGYNFTCCCACCSDTATGATSSDSRRTLLQQLGRDLPAIGTRNPTNGIHTVSKLLELYDQEGINLNIFRKQATYYAFQFALQAGHIASARDWAQQAHQYSTLSCGGCHPETIWLHGYALDPESHPTLRTPAFDVVDPGRRQGAMDPALKFYALALVCIASLVSAMIAIAEHFWAPESE